MGEGSGVNPTDLFRWLLRVCLGRMINFEIDVRAVFHNFHVHRSHLAALLMCTSVHVSDLEVLGCRLRFTFLTSFLGLLLLLLHRPQFEYQGV